MSQSLIARLGRKFFNNSEVEEFTNEIVSKFKVRKTQVEYIILQEAKDLALFDAFIVEPESYIRQALKNCSKWSTLPRRKIKAEDLTTYGTAYLFFQAIERK